MKRLCNAVLVAILTLSLAVPAGFAGPRQTQTQSQQAQTASTDSSQQPEAQDQQQPSSSDQPQTPKDVKPGSEKDVESIGNRGVGHGVNIYSLEKEIAMGKGAAQEVERSAKLITDPVVTDRKSVV